MYWLLAEHVARELERAKRNFAPTAAQIDAFDKRQAEALDQPRNYRTAGNDAEIVVEGVLSKRREMFFYYYGGSSCTYNDIIESLALAEADPNISKVILRIDSPGGQVAGLLETVNAIAAFTKPIVARCTMALSAAYDLAAACDRVEAVNEASEFGCLGVAVTYTFWESEELVTLTNTDSPEKRPDPRTAEGKASIVRHLDATNKWFVDSIARGRAAAGKSVTAKDVSTDFGRGATLLAPDAKKLGMIDGYATQRAGTAQGRVRAESNPNNENDTMNKKLLAQALGISESATDEAFEAAAVQQATELRDAKAEATASKAQVTRLEAMTGKTGEEAHGVLLAWKGSHEELPTVSAKLSKLEADAEAGQLDGAIAKAKSESRWTPARETEVRKLLADKDCTAAGAKAMVGAWGVVAAIAAGKDGASAALGSSSGPAGADRLKHNGKTYTEMNGAERHKLHAENEELFNAMRKQAVDAGEI